MGSRDIRVAFRAVRSRQPDSVDAVQATLARLVREREALRLTGADRAAREQNRLEIVERHRALRRALIAQHVAAANGGRG